MQTGAVGVESAPTEREALVVIDELNHYYGEGELRRQILFGISAEIHRGEIVILAGPSGGGKTTLVTLIGGLRSVQDGSVKVLGRELNGASEADLVHVRKRIGYVFQAHNLLDSLTALQNVQMAMRLQSGYSRKQARDQCVEMLRAVGLADRADHFARALSGGQKQRVAIARALVNQPQMILADEPTASLDKQSGRDVVDLLQKLAKHQGCTVFLVTHDNRILDIADRIFNLEDGRLVSFADTIATNTRYLLDVMAQHNRKAELTRRVTALDASEFARLLETITAEFTHLVQALEVSNSEAFESTLDQVLEAFTLKVGQILHADRASLFLLDESKAELWSKVAQSADGAPLEIRVPWNTGLVGQVAATGQPRNVADVYAEPLFNPEVDRRTGYRTRSMLCMPIENSKKRVFAVVQLLNKGGGEPFDANDERQLREFAASIGVVLETWWLMTQRARSSPLPSRQGTALPDDAARV